MASYIIRESELRSAIKKIIAEEIDGLIGESLAGALGHAALNTLKTAAIGAVAPGVLANKVFTKTNNILNGPDTITGTVSDFFGGNKIGSSDKASGRQKSKAEKQRKRLSATRGISGEYGKPETIPGIGRRIKLDRKDAMTLPTESHVEWGDFGIHYHDEGDRMWFRKVLDTERALERASHGDASRQNRLQKRYKRALVDWLKERDREYENYIKTIN